MSVKNIEFGELMEHGVDDLVKHSEFNKSTAHVVFNAEKISMPENITEQSLADHVNWINGVSAQVETANARIAREQYEHDNKLTTVDGTLNLGALTINTQHHLKQQVGEEFLYGQATTAVDYMHTPEAAEWLQTQRTSSQELAAKLFG